MRSWVLQQKENCNEKGFQHVLSVATKRELQRKRLSTCFKCCNEKRTATKKAFNMF